MFIAVQRGGFELRQEFHVDVVMQDIQGRQKRDMNIALLTGRRETSSLIYCPIGFTGAG